MRLVETHYLAREWAKFIALGGAAWWYRAPGKGALAPPLCLWANSPPEDIFKQKKQIEAGIYGAFETVGWRGAEGARAWKWRVAPQTEIYISGLPLVARCSGVKPTMRTRR